MSRNNCLWATLAPASRATRVQARSMGAALPSDVTDLVGRNYLMHGARVPNNALALYRRIMEAAANAVQANHKDEDLWRAFLLLDCCLRAPLDPELQETFTTALRRRFGLLLNADVVGLIQEARRRTPRPTADGVFVSRKKEGRRAPGVLVGGFTGAHPLQYWATFGRA